MKIAVIKNNIPFPCANVINTLKHAQAFYKLGHCVKVLTMEQILEEIWRIKLKNIQRFYGISSKISIKYFRGNLINYFSKFKIFNPPLKLLKLFPLIYDTIDPEIQMSNYCIRKKVDFVYCRSTLSTAYRNIINKIPTILETHYFNFPLELQRVFTLSYSKYFLGVITISDVLKRSIIKQGVPEDKILVLEDAVELSKFNKIKMKKEFLRKHLNLPLNKKLIIYVGNLGPGRGIETIINASKYLDKIDFVFYILGGERYWIKKWKNYIKKREIDANISFLGLIENRSIPYFLKAADVLLATYTKDLSTLKWMSPIKLFEYMASKIPIIASDVQRIKEICSNNECLFFKAGDSGDLSEKIKDLINDRDLQEKLIQIAFKKAEKHTYIIRSQKILELFNKSFLV